MGNYYSIDLREKVVDYVLGGASQVEAARVFGLGRSTIQRWLKRSKEGQLEPIILHDYKSKKLDLMKLKQYVDAHREATIYEISLHFKVSCCAVWYKLRKLGYVIKKNDVVQGKKRRTTYRVQEKASGA